MKFPENKNRWGLGCLLLLSLVVLGLNPAGRDPWAPDEPVYAEVAREMWERGDYFVPHLNGKIYYAKPPGFFWLIILCSLPAGRITDTTVCLPSVFLGSATLLLLYLWTRKYQEAIPPLAPPLILLTSNLFWWFGGRARIDTSFSFFITAALLAFHHGYRRRSFGFYTLAYLAMGIGLVVKGPFALLPAMIIIIHLLVQKDLTALKRLRLPIGFVIVLVPTAIWLAPAVISKGMPYLERAVIHQIGGRLTDSYSHAHPVYFYLYMLPARFLPWSLLLIMALILLGRRKLTVDGGLRFSLIWAGTVFIVISLISAKQPHYLLPLFPALAVITARFLTVPQNRGIQTAGIITFCLLLIMPLIAAGAIGLNFPQFSFPVISCAIALLAFTLAHLRLIRLDKHFSRRILFCVSGYMCLLFFWSNLWILPEVNRRKSPGFILRPYLEEISKTSLAVYQPDLRVGNYPFFIRDTVRELHAPEEIRQYSAGGKNRFLLLKQESFERFTPDFKNRFQILSTRRVGSKQLLLAVSR